MMMMMGNILIIIFHTNVSLLVQCLRHEPQVAITARERKMVNPGRNFPGLTDL
jgi:hypothetical protein